MRRESRSGPLAALALLAALGSGCVAPSGAPLSEGLRDADSLAEAGDLGGAIARLERELQATPDEPEISIRIGELERQRGRAEEAYAAFRRASELAPEDLRALSGLALSADALGFEDEAREAYARWHELEDASDAAD